MAFGGLEFVFDGINCKEYGLKIFSISGSGRTSFSGGSNATLHTDKSPSGYKINLLGVSEDEPLTFELSFGTMSPMNRYEVSTIQKWLFGHKEYKKLQIIQDDLFNVHYNCILSDSKIETLGNHPVLITCKVTCDSPFAWEESKTYTYTQSSFAHYNTSDINDYIYPTVRLVATGGTVTIVNASNDNYATTIEGLVANEVITLDCERKIISSSRGLNRLEKFNKNWFELVSGINNISIQGITTMDIIYANAKRIGGA